MLVYKGIISFQFYATWEAFWKEMVGAYLKVLI
jgi:hypothetical protein